MGAGGKGAERRTGKVERVRECHVLDVETRDATSRLKGLACTSNERSCHWIMFSEPENSGKDLLSHGQKEE